jgi:acetyl/propionyl-CoA carboxylase alpha subunit
MVTGLDLLGMQLFVASGGALPAGERPIAPRGHAIELRVCAEDPANQFAPQAGKILHLELPTGPGVRVDCGVRAGYEVPTHYDSLLMKVIVAGPTRASAIERAKLALRDLVILGPTTNVPYLRAILEDEAFAAGELSTSFLGKRFADWKPADEVSDAVLLAAAAGEYLAGTGATSAKAAKAATSADAAQPSPWDTLGAWRMHGEGGS